MNDIGNKCSFWSFAKLIFLIVCHGFNHEDSLLKYDCYL